MNISFCSFVSLQILRCTEVGPDRGILSSNTNPKTVFYGLRTPDAKIYIKHY